MSNGLLQVYNRFPITFEVGKGVFVYDDKGKSYLDAGAGIAVNAFGHCHPEIIRSLEEQAKKLWHISNLYYSKPQKELAELLCANSFADYVFFTNSGTEAVECAFKTSWRYQHAKGKPHKRKIISFTGAFHGRTHACISSTGTKTADGFGTVTEDFVMLPFNDFYALSEALNKYDDIAGIIIEPIQGEGGIKTADKAFLQKLRDICDQDDICLIFDEIQAGMGRAGKLFSYELFDVIPDIATSAKGIGAGFPLGACLVSQKASLGMVHGTHGSTYGGNPLACAVGLKAVSMILADGFLQSVCEKGEVLKKALLELKDEFPNFIIEVRGTGLIQGIQFHESYKARDIAQKCLELEKIGLIVIPASDNVTRILPPLIISEEEILLLQSKLRELFTILGK